MSKIVTALKLATGVLTGQHRLGFSIVNELQAFPGFDPNSGNGYRTQQRFLRQAANGVFRSMVLLGERLSLNPPTELLLAELRVTRTTEDLGNSFARFGSDKASTHNYYRFYALAIEALNGCKNGILEIGLGTNNTSVISNMGKGGSPGASLRAFRDHSTGQVYGADIDRSVLFSEKRISTFFLDQLDAVGIGEFELTAPRGLDLFIDDGLHSVTANLNSLGLGFRLTNESGIIVIEDIRGPSVDLWRFVGMVMSQLGVPSWLLRDEGGAYLFVASKLKTLTLT